MMLRSRRLEVVLSLEERREQAALETMAAARKAWEAQHQRLEELQRYQQEYRNQVRGSQQGTVPVSRLQGWQAFIAQLDQVIQQQERQLAQAQVRLDDCRQAWQQAYERRRGMEKYITACRNQEQRAQDQKEQKLSDEAAGRAHSRRR